MVYSLEQETFIVMSYYRNGTFNNGEWTYSVQACKNEFRAKYPDIEIQEASLMKHIREVVNRFLRTGSVNKGKSTGRPQVSDDVVDDLRERLEQNPRTSLPKLSLQSGVPLSTVHKIVNKRLHMHPYKVAIAYQLLPPDFPRRVEYCNWFQNNLDDDRILDVTFFSDEAWFHMSGYVNSHNCRYWSTENPHEFIETPLHPQKIGVWLAVSRRRVYGPVFFQGSITGQRYREELLRPFIEQLDDIELQQGYFQQDGATAHTAGETLRFLRQFYGDRVISLGVNPEFPPRSPDLTPLDFSIFGYLKDQVFQRQFENLQELQDEITRCCQNLNQDILQNIFENMKRRVRICIDNNGEHFQHLL